MTEKQEDVFVDLESKDPSVASKDVDDAMKAEELLQRSDVHIDEASNRRLCRRIDMFIMPMLCLVYGLNFLDKTTLSYSSVMGIQKDIGLTANDYSWLGSIFYFGYLAWEFPAGRLMQRLPLGKYLGTFIVLWGVVLSCFAAVHNFAGAAALRLILGILEASTMPGFALLVSQWYRKEEQSLRTSLWASFAGLAQIFGGLVAYGLAHGQDEHPFSIAPWKIVFLFTGLLTVVGGFVFLALVPDSPLQAWWLSREDRALAVERLKRNQQGIGNRTFKWYQLREALLDPLSWAFFVMALAADIPNGGITNFFNLLVRSFGYTAEQSLLYATPAGAVEVVALLGWGLVTRRYGNVLLWALAPVGVSLVGAILIVALPAEYRAGRLVGYFLTLAFVCGVTAVVTMISANVAGYTKKTTVAAMFSVGFSVGNIIGPQTFRASDAPDYVPAKIGIIVCFAIVILDLLFMYCYCRWMNAKKARARADPAYRKLEHSEWLDLTDRENVEFVYTL